MLLQTCNEERKRKDLQLCLCSYWGTSTNRDRIRVRRNSSPHHRIRIWPYARTRVWIRTYATHRRIRIWGTYTRGRRGDAVRL